MIWSRMRQRRVDHRHTVKKWTCWHRKASKTDEWLSRNKRSSSRLKHWKAKIKTWFKLLTLLFDFKFLLVSLYDAIWFTFVSHYATVGNTFKGKTIQCEITESLFKCLKPFQLLWTKKTNLIQNQRMRKVQYIVDYGYYLTIGPWGIWEID